MTFMMGDTEDDFAIPADTEGSAGPRTGFLQNFEAAYAEQAHVNSALGADEDMSNLEQQQLDKLYSLTGERMSPVFPGAWSSGDLSASPQFAIMHNLNGDQLDAEQQAFVTAAQDHMQRYDKLAAIHGLLTYDQMFKQVQQNARQAVGNAANTYNTASVGGMVGSFLGSAAGSMTYRDPVNLASLALGGPGKTMIAHVVADMGIQGISHMVDLLTGAAENQQLLTGKAPTFGEELEQSAETGIGAGVFRAGGEAIAHGFGAIARRFGAQAPDIAAGAVAQEAENAIGPSPYGPSRLAEGMHTADVLDALARDVPLNQRPVAERLVDPAVGGGKFPIAPLASSDADALFTDTAKPLANLFDSVPATPEMDRANAALSSITAEIAKADADATAIVTKYQSENGGLTPSEVMARATDQWREVVAARDKHDKINSTLEDWLVEPANAIKSRLTKQTIKPLTLPWERKRAAAIAQWTTANTVAVQHETALEAGAHLRLVRAQMVDAIAEAVPSAQRSGSVQSLIDRTGASENDLRPIDRPVSSPSASDEIERVLNEARRAPMATTPRLRMIPATEPGMPDMADIGSHSGPIDLDHEIVAGTDGDGNPVFMTVRQMLQEHADDEALINAMKTCLIA